jgi:GNAT superfamily N-acetyltransferase
MEMKSIQIRRVEVGIILDLRHRVLRTGLPRESANFAGDDEAGTIHLAAVLGEEIVGCATVMRISFEGEGACQLRGMGVDEEYQHAGIGKMLLEEVDRVALGQGVGLLWANARAPALGFYRRQGWEVVGGEFVVPTAGPHFKIVRRLGVNSPMKL